ARPPGESHRQLGGEVRVGSAALQAAAVRLVGVCRRVAVEVRARLDLPVGVVREALRLSQRERARDPPPERVVGELRRVAVGVGLRDAVAQLVVELSRCYRSSGFTRFHLLSRESNTCSPLYGIHRYPSEKFKKPRGRPALLHMSSVMTRP